MKIWIIDHYSVPVKYYPLARNTNFAKNFMKMGHEVIIFAASTVHNSDINLIEDCSKYKELVDDGVKYVVVKCHQYKGNGFSRILNMYEFAWKLESVCNKYPKPDAIISSSMTLQACKKGIQIGQKYGCRKVAQITDLWPETLVAHNIAKEKSIPVMLLRKTEKWIYMNCDSVVFTMFGAYSYIKKQKWEKEVPPKKVFYINNGVDIHIFDENKRKYTLSDEDLDNNDTYKIIYTGSLRKANSQLFYLLEVAELLSDAQHKDIRILIYGKGDIKHEIESICEKKGLTNVLLKGYVRKESIPYILSKCDINILNCTSSEILKYGGSQNKLFEYLASGHPIISGEDPSYSVVARHNCGIVKQFTRPSEIVSAIDILRTNGPSYKHIRSVAEKYDFSILTKKMLSVLEGKEEIK